MYSIVQLRAMTTVLGGGPWGVFFSADRHEPSNVRFEREDKYAKFWAEPVRLQERSGC